MELQLILTQENSDATCNYNVLIPDNTTINDFVDLVLTHNLTLKKANRQERGIIKISPYITICTYEGYIAEFKDAFFDYKDCIIKRVWANGGWGLMDYYLTI